MLLQMERAAGLTTVLTHTELDTQASGRSTHSSTSTHSWGREASPHHLICVVPSALNSALTGSDLFVRLGVVQSCSSQRRPPQAWRAGPTAEPPHRVHTGIRRETRLQRALQHRRGRCISGTHADVHACSLCVCVCVRLDSVSLL